MLYFLSSRIMPRTTIDIDAAVLRELKRLQKRERKTLGQLVSELLSAALARREGRRARAPGFAWTARPMGARVDLEDKEAVRAALESA
jgi:Arc/MetJ family transcription regulator